MLIVVLGVFPALSPYVQFGTWLAAPFTVGVGAARTTLGSQR